MRKPGGMTRSRCAATNAPQVYLIGRPERGRAAITYTRRLIREGKIVAIKGIGGFHLCCDATNEEVVCRLRTLKNRPVKPFAVMAKDESVVKRECVVTPEQEAILTGHQKPILFLDRRSDGGLASSVAPNNPKVGVMLPYAPVQLLIFQYDDGIEMPDLLVMTVEILPVHRSVVRMRKLLPNYPICVMRCCHITAKSGYGQMIR